MHRGLDVPSGRSYEVGSLSMPVPQYGRIDTNVHIATDTCITQPWRRAACTDGWCRAVDPVRETRDSEESRTCDTASRRRATAPGQRFARTPASGHARNLQQRRPRWAACCAFVGDPG